MVLVSTCSRQQDTERRLQRFECAISNDPPINNTVEVVEVVAEVLDELRGEFFDFFVFFNTSGMKNTFSIQHPCIHTLHTYTFNLYLCHTATGFCDAESVDGLYWPETKGGVEVTQECATGNGIARRMCGEDRLWQDPECISEWTITCTCMSVCLCTCSGGIHYHMSFLSHP